MYLGHPSQPQVTTNQQNTNSGTLHVAQQGHNNQNQFYSTTQQTTVQERPAAEQITQNLGKHSLNRSTLGSFLRTFLKVCYTKTRNFVNFQVITRRFHLIYKMALIIPIIPL